MVRNRELWGTGVLLGLVYLLGAALFFGIHPACGALFLALAGALLAIFYASTRLRYRRIAQLSDYLKWVSDGHAPLDIRDHQEGELSVLKSELFKVTQRLSSQSEQLAREKLSLVNSISDISHQLKTPLTSMGVLTDLLEQEALPADRRRAFAQRVRSQLTRMEWLVTSLLKLSRLDAGAVAFQRIELPAARLVEQALEPLRIPLELREQRLRLQGEGRAMVYADAKWTCEALVNVLKNCMEHTPPGGEIAVSYEENPIYASICISDTGEGILKEDLPYIFNRFYRGKNAGSDSVGIGLAMSRAIMVGQGGDIIVKSRPGEGSRFEFRFIKQVT